MSRYRAGYDARPPLVGPTVAEGDAQRLAASTTSATVTVGAASGGGGAYTYSAPAIDRPGGSSAAVSGTAPGALSVSGLVDGESVVVSGTVTDDGTGQSAEWSSTVAVEASGGGGGGGSWAQTWIVDHTGSDALAMSIDGTYDLQKSGVTYQQVIFSENGSVNATITAGAAGLSYAYIGGTSGHCAVSFDTLAKFGITGPATADDLAGQRAIQWLVTGVSFPGNNAERVHFGVSDTSTAPASSAEFIAGSAKDDNTNADLGIYSGSDKDVEANTAYNADYLFTLLIIDGVMGEVWVTPGATAFSDPRAETYGPWLVHRNPTAGAMPVPYSAGLFAVAAGRRKIDWTLAQVRGLTFS